MRKLLGNPLIVREQGFEHLVLGAQVALNGDCCLLALGLGERRSGGPLPAVPLPVAYCGLLPAQAEMAHASSVGSPLDPGRWCSSCDGPPISLSNSSARSRCAAAEHLAGSLGLRGFAARAIFSRGTCRGYIFVGSERPREFTLRERGLLDLMADATSVILQGRIDFEESKTESMSLRRLLDASSEVHRLQGLESVMSRACASSNDLLRMDLAYLALADPARQEVRVSMSHGVRTPNWNDMRIKYNEGIGGVVAVDRRATRVADYASDPRIHYTDDIVRRMIIDEGIVSGMVAPMVRDSELVGVLFVARRGIVDYSDTELSLFEDFAFQSAMAVDNVRGFALANHRAVTLSKMVRLVSTASDYNAIATHLQEVLKVAVVICDTQHNPVAMDMWIDSKARCNLLSRYFSPTKKALISRGEAAARGCARGERRALVHAIPEDEFCNWIVVPIEYLGRLLGYIHLFDDGEIEHAVDTSIAEDAGAIVAMSMMRTVAVAEAKQAVRGELIDELISDSPLQRRHAVARATKLGYRRDAHYVCYAIRLVVPVDGRPESATSRNAEDYLDRTLAAIRDVHRGVDYRNLTQKHLGDVISVVEYLEHTEEVPAWVKRTGIHILQESKRVAERGCIVGVSSVVTGPEELYRAFSEAVACLDIAVANGRSDVVAMYSELGATAVLYEAIGSDRVLEFANVRLAQLIEKDGGGRMDLLHTLCTYLGTGGNKTATARQLHVHLNTLKYRLGRIEELLNCDLSDAEHRFELDLATRIHGVANGMALRPQRNDHRMTDLST